MRNRLSILVFWDLEIPIKIYSYFNLTLRVYITGICLIGFNYFQTFTLDSLYPQKGVRTKFFQI